MKANELMMGDWVEFETPTTEFLYGKVIEISEHCMTIGTLNDSVCVKTDKVKQIPITRDILEKNGFWRELEGYYRNNDGLCIEQYLSSWFIYDNYKQLENDNSLMSCFAVHELQNILRILGFNDLANNFNY